MTGRDVTGRDGAALDRFVAAQTGSHDVALAELRAGRKRGHWMWFVFPQLRGLGRSETAQFYGIADLAEARAYAAHPLLGPRLNDAAEAMLRHAGQNAEAILGPIDAMKLRSSATLFRAASADPAPFAALLEAFFAGRPCPRTVAMLGK